MSLVKNKDKRTGITYVYESESYWDKEKQQPRSHRRLIGKLDNVTGEIIPTDGRGHNRREKKDDTTLSKTADYEAQVREKDLEIQRLKDEIFSLKKEKAAVIEQLRKTMDLITGR